MNEMANIDIQIVFPECINQYYRKFSVGENEITVFLFFSENSMGFEAALSSLIRTLSDFYC